jgi:hypothetical protein
MGVWVCPPIKKLKCFFNKKERQVQRTKRKNEDEFKHNGERKRDERAGIHVSDECDECGKNVVGEIWL